MIMMANIMHSEKVSIEIRMQDGIRMVRIRLGNAKMIFMNTLEIVQVVS